MPASINMTRDEAYREWLASVKRRIHAVRVKIALSANSELIALYYELGAQISERESTAQWGTGFIDAFSRDLKTAFPGVGGFSAKNLRYCRAFFRFYCDSAIWQQAVAKLDSVPWVGVDAELASRIAQIPWGHNILIFTKCASVDEAGFYIAQFLLELGKGFAFIGRQYHVEIAENDYYIDLLFYHVTLKCFVVVELKNRKFTPEYAGKLNFYLSAVDTLLKRDDDQPSIGLLLCRDKNNIEVEFALRDMNKPMGVSEYTLVETLPDNLKGAMPTVEEIEQDLKQLKAEDDEHE